MGTDLQDIVNATINARSGDLAKNIEQSNLLLHLIGNMRPPKPLTPMEKLRRKLADYEYRVIGAWKVLKGDAYIEEEE